MFYYYFFTRKFFTLIAYACIHSAYHPSMFSIISSPIHVSIHLIFLFPTFSPVLFYTLLLILLYSILFSLTLSTLHSLPLFLKVKGNYFYLFILYFSYFFVLSPHSPPKMIVPFLPGFLFISYS